MYKVNDSILNNLIFTQSKNSSAKLALIIQSNVLELYNIDKVNNDGKWHVIPDYTLQVSQTGFAFAANNYAYEGFNEITQRLTSAGVMDHMIQKCFGRQKSILDKKHWSVLVINNLEFGFFIWLACCAFCFFIFIFEIFFSFFCNFFEI